MSLCACGLDRDVWQNPWNHRPGCSMQPAPEVLADVLPGVARDLSRRRVEARLRLVVETCDTALASPHLDDATRSLIESIRDQAMGVT